MTRHETIAKLRKAAINFPLAYMLLAGLSHFGGFAEAQSATDAPKVEVFATERCGACKPLEKYLRGMNISYTRYDLDKDTAARRDYLDNIGHGDIPVTRINDTIIRGNEAAKVQKAYEAARTPKEFKFDNPIRSPGGAQ